LTQGHTFDRDCAFFHVFFDKVDVSKDGEQTFGRYFAFEFVVLTCGQGFIGVYGALGQIKSWIVMGEEGLVEGEAREC
jgi:hypothetical protein